MKKRRLTAALLCAVLAASTVLSGCGGKKTTEGGSTAQAGKEAVIRMELQKVHDKVKKLTGKDMTLFRPPYGDYNNQVVEMADSMGYYPIQWDVDSLDWKDYGADSIVDMVLNNPHLGNGSIILMHNGAKYTPDALDAVITGLQEKGFELVTVSELIWKENFYLDQEGRQIAE